MPVSLLRLHPQWKIFFCISPLCSPAPLDDQSRKLHLLHFSLLWRHLDLPLPSDLTMTVSLSFYPFADSFTWRLFLRLKRKVIDNDCYIDLYFCSINITQCRNFSNKVWNVGIRQKQCKKTYFSTNHSSFPNEQRIENGKINLSPISSLSITYLAEPFQYSSCGSGHCPLADSLSQNTQQNGLNYTGIIFLHQEK